MLKKILLSVLALSLSLALFACGGDTTCTAHTDSDSNGKCDTCGETVENNENNENNGNNTASAIDLIKDGKINFQVVRASSSGGGVMMLLNTLKMNVEGMGATLDIVDDKAGNEKDIEVLIGDVTSRGEKYIYDKYSLGVKGYVITLVDNKIIINAGSTNTLVDAVEEFIEDILGIKSSTKTLTDTIMTNDKTVLKVQDDYRVTSITINGAEINGYTIAYDYNSGKHQSAASSLNKFLYENAGYYLPLVKLEDAGKSIIIEAVDYAGEDGFLVKTEESGALRIQCAYDNKFEEAFNAFFSNELRIKTGDIAFDSSYNYTYEASVVYYEDFLHLSVDGNDYPAIKAAHDFANECGQTVKSKGGTYYITLLEAPRDDGTPLFRGAINIMTDVDWSNAEFIIDDTEIGPLEANSDSKTNIFNIASMYESQKLTLTGDKAKEIFPDSVGPETTKINWTADYPVMMILYNSNHHDHVRYGGDYTTRGRAQKEIILVDENGNIDPQTRLLYDFTEVTNVIIRRIDDDPLSIKGGKFTTLASQIPVVRTGKDSELYISRGVKIMRSNVTVKNVKHYVQGELPGTTSDNKGLSYNGFFNLEEVNNVMIESCVLTGRKYYQIAGTYDFACSSSSNVTLKNCTQSNFHLANGDNSMQGSAYWGCGTSNYTKNLVYDGTTLSRFDAHASLFGGKIINSTVTSINLIGGGDMLIENSTIEVVSAMVVNLRSDYGATWNGTITIKDCNIVFHNSASNNPREMNILYMPWANHDFGYTCHMPNLVLDNLTFAAAYDCVNILSSSGTKDGSAPTYSLSRQPNMHLEILPGGEKNINPMQPPKFIELKNNKANIVYKILNAPFFDGTNIIGNILKQ